METSYGNEIGIRKVSRHRIYGARKGRTCKGMCGTVMY